MKNEKDEKKEEVIELTYIGTAGFDELPVYKDQFNNYWCDTNVNAKKDSEFHKFIIGMDEHDDWKEILFHKELITDYYNGFKAKVITNIEKDPNVNFNYQMLNRLKMDCDYFLGNGNKNEKKLWNESITDHIKEMKELWHSFPEEKKPEWITLEDIEEYSREMNNSEEELEQQKEQDNEFEF